MATTFIGNINSSNDKAGTYSRDIELLNKTLNKYRENGDKEKADLTQRIIDIVEEHMDNTFGGYGITGNGKKSLNTTTSNKTKPYKKEEDATEGSIDAQTKKVQELQKAWRAAADDDSREKIKEQIEEAQYALDKLTGKEKFDPAKMSDLKSFSVPVVPEMKLDDSIKNATDAFSKKHIEIEAELKADALKADAATLTTILKDSIQNGINGMDLQLSSLSKQIADGIDVPNEKWQAILDQYNHLREQIGLDPIKINFETGNIQQLAKDAQESTKEFNNAARAIQSVGSAMSQIEDPTAKVAGMIAQAIASIALGFSEMIGKDVSSKGNVWYGIAAAAAGIASMVTTISQIHSATGYANGGIVDGSGGGFVGGTSFSGDNIGNVHLDSGEMVLNKFQQQALAGTLENGGMRDLNVRGYLKGEDLMISIDRTGRRQGRGELAFFK